ncbi:carbohydrate ABC transporter permease [Thermoanaerobacterium thermosaccharolyticum]|uniref:carbohydrate ABC transporter permease n=1 Tax=Thermoanaerobacterium thermosaccharolyticum TaxID=1517 RepID=UPI0037DA536E
MLKFNYREKKKIKKIISLLCLWIFVAFTVFPIIWMVISSTTNQQDLLSGDIRPSFKNILANYHDMWTNINFGMYFKNSVIIVSCTTILALSIAILAGYALARFKFIGSNLFGIATLGTQMIPGILFLLPLYLIFIQMQQTFGIKMVNTYHGIILTYSAFYIPFSIWILRGFFASIPMEIEEAARIDGCTQFSAFLRVILPLAIPGIVATAIYIFLMAWDELLFAWVLTTSADVQTIPVGIRLFVGQYQNRYDLLMAASTVVTIPIALMFFLLQKYFISGMTAGAVKG